MELRGKLCLFWLFYRAIQNAIELYRLESGFAGKGHCGLLSCGFPEQGRFTADAIVLKLLVLGYENPCSVLLSLA